MLSVLMHVMAIFAMITSLWAIYGYSLAFSGGGGFYGDFGKLFLKGIAPDTLSGTIPRRVRRVPVHLRRHHLRADRRPSPSASFSAVLLFSLLWFTSPTCRWRTWCGAPSGMLFKQGALDFAGGTVVHINAGVAGLVGAWVIGRRIGYGREAMAPHSLTFTMIGASLLWVGWFGFNAGSASGCQRYRGRLAFINTILATGAAMLAW